ncbi:MAG TPA: hypothetical protein VLA78_00200 [Paracoccaceae bacterium]|nr:hypothetical protein [Paracoccaceae bacterium]
MRFFLILAGVAAALSACAPIPLARAEEQCFEQARLAARPRGEIGIGAATDGTTRGRFEVTVTSDYLMGRDPSAVYDSCVFNKSGQPPSRPLYSRPDWKG